MADDKKKINADDVHLSVPEVNGPRAQMYVNHVIWVAAYTRQRAALGGITEEQIIGQFEMNVRRVMNPEWKPH